MFKSTLKLLILTLVLFFAAFGAGAQQTPSVGQHAPNFTLNTPEGKPVSLSALYKKSPVVLVVLRGYPGYQCPFCVKQVHDYVENAAAFSRAGATVLLVYPGPPSDLDAHAKEFLIKQNQMPAGVVLVIDPDYRFTVEYGLRWEKEHETAYPSTFLINRQGDVFFSKVSEEHGERTTAADMLAELAKRPAK